MSLKVPGALWVPKWAQAPDLVAAFRRARLERGTRWEDSPSWIAGQLGLSRWTVRRALRELPDTGHDRELLAPIHRDLLAAPLPVRARLLATHIWRRDDRGPPRAYHPTLRDLAADFSWSRRTVDRMVARLVAEGVLEERVVHVQGSKVQVTRHVTFTELSTGLSTETPQGPRVEQSAAGEWSKARPVSGENRGRQVEQSAAGTSRYQMVPVPHGSTVPGGTTEGAAPVPEEGCSLRSRPSPGDDGRAPGSARRFSFALPDLPDGALLGTNDDPVWRRALLPETREGLAAGACGPALAWLLTTLGVGGAYRLGRQLDRNGFGVGQVLEHVERIHKLVGIRNRAAMLASELRDLLQGFR